MSLQEEALSESGSNRRRSRKLPPVSPSKRNLKNLSVVRREEVEATNRLEVVTSDDSDNDDLTDETIPENE